MGITAKELTSKLNLSEAAVSMVLRNKQGVSTQTRKLVLETACTESDYKLHVTYIHKDDDVQKRVEKIIYSDSAGIVLLGTEMQLEGFQPFSGLRIPLVVLDVYFDSIEYDWSPQHKW